MIERNSMGLAGLGTLAVLLTMTACKSDKVSGDGAPPTPSQVTNTGDMSLVSVDKPDQFPLIAAASYDKAAELSATGAVFPDIAREVPVISLASEMTRTPPSPSTRISRRSTTSNSPARPTCVPRIFTSTAPSRRRCWKPPRTLKKMRRPT
jgi:hypothetical protein